MCGIAGLVYASGAAPPTPAVLSRLIDALHHRGPDGTGHARARPRRPGAQPPGDHRPGDRRPAAVRRPGGAGGERRDLQLPRAARGDAGHQLRHQQRLRAAAASVAARRGGLCKRAARHVRDRHPRARATQRHAERATRSASSRCTPPRSRTAWRSPRSRRRCWKRGWSNVASARRRARSCCNCSSPPAPRRSSRASGACCRARR